MKKQMNVRKLVITSLLAAIIVAIGWPGSPLSILGFIPMGVFSATTLHIPVLVGAILEGPLTGGILGAVFGFVSLMRSLIAPTSPLSVVFVNPIVSITPRLVMGVAAGFIARALDRKATRRSGSLSAAATGALGAIINVSGVLPLTYLFSKELFLQYMIPEASYVMYGVLTLIATNTIPEAIVAAIICTGVYTALRPYYISRGLLYSKNRAKKYSAKE